jgi:lipopolysaccharide export system protein LptA
MTLTAGGKELLFKNGEHLQLVAISGKARVRQEVIEGKKVVSTQETDLGDLNVTARANQRIQFTLLPQGSANIQVTLPNGLPKTDTAGECAEDC